MWDKLDVQLGRVPVGEAISLEFNYEGKEDFISASSSCGCTKPEWDDKDKVLKAVYVPKPVPSHLISNGKLEYSTIKSITVKMEGKDKPEFFTMKIYSIVYDPKMK